MEIKNIAEELAKAITESEEFRVYHEAKKRLKTDQMNYEILEEFRQRQWDIQLESMLGEEISVEEKDMVDELYSSLSENKDINEFLLAEYKFTKILSEVQDILLACIKETSSNEASRRVH